MNLYLFPPPPQPSLPVQGEGRRYPVSRIFCVGRNYEDHAKEIGQKIDRERPFYFAKSAHTLAQDGDILAYPPGTQDYHFEVELVIALGAPVFKANREQALAAIFGYAVGLDMTRRDLQLAERSQQRPWTLGKDVEQSAPVSAIAPAHSVGHPRSALLTLTQNGVMRQKADIASMVWPIPDLIAHLSGFYHLNAGDLVFTGTPAGVGPVQPGDFLRGEIAGIGTLCVTIGSAS